MPLAVEPRLVLEAVLQGAAHDGLAVDDAVGLGHDAAIDGARLVVARCPVILGSVGDGIDLVGGEPLPQPRVVTHDGGTVDVVQFAAMDQSQVVIGGRYQQHARVHLWIVLCQLQCLGDDGAGVVGAVPAVKAVVTRNDLPLDKVHDFLKIPFHIRSRENDDELMMSPSVSRTGGNRIAVFHLAAILAVEDGDELVAGLGGEPHVTLEVLLVPEADEPSRQPDGEQGRDHGAQWLDSNGVVGEQLANDGIVHCLVEDHLVARVGQVIHHSVNLVVLAA